MRVLRRWINARHELVAALALGVALISISWADQRAVEESGAALDANWRGAYDILVTSSTEDFGADSTAGLVDPNFVSTPETTGISLSDLSNIRRIAGVEVAAPIGVVGTIRSTALSPFVYVIDNVDEGYSDVPSDSPILRLTSTLTRKGLSTGDQVLSQTRGMAMVANRSVLASRGDGEEAAGYPQSFAPMSNTLSYSIPLGELPAFTSTVVAVDPAAEKLLAVDGDYLDGLADSLPSGRSEANAAEWSKVIDGTEYQAQVAALDFLSLDSTTSGNIVPLLVNESRSSQLSLTVTLEKYVGPDLPDVRGTSLKAAGETDSFEPLTTLDIDASDLVVPFSTPDLRVKWGPSPLPEGEGRSVFYGDTSISPQKISRPTYTIDEQAPNGLIGFRLDPTGTVGADGAPPRSSEFGAVPNVGNVTAYRESERGGSTGAIFPAPVGRFSTADVADSRSEDASYVPTGLAQAEAIVVESDVPSVPTGATVVPGLSGVDFLTQAPGAITDLEGGAVLRGGDPIDAIRVRVAGVTAFNEEGRARVENVAEQIANLGLTARVVAGSSPQTVALYVPDYFMSESGNSDLGWVSQDWTTLGAAVTISNALSDLLISLILETLAALAVAYGVTTAIGGLQRRREASLLATIGWTRPQVIGSMAGSSAINVLLVSAAATVAILIGPGREVAAATAISAVGAAVVFAGISITLTLRKPSVPRAVVRRRQLSTVPGLSLRQAVSAWPSHASRAIGVAAIGISVFLAALSVRDALNKAGDTRLAEVVLGASVVPIATLSLAALAGALVLIIVGTRQARIQAKRFDLILREIGLSIRIASRARLIGELLAFSPALVLLIGIIAAVSIGAGFDWIAITIALAIQTACILIAASYSLRPIGNRS